MQAIIGIINNRDTIIKIVFGTDAVAAGRSKLEEKYNCSKKTVIHDINFVTITELKLSVKSQFHT